MSQDPSKTSGAAMPRSGATGSAQAGGGYGRPAGAASASAGTSSFPVPSGPPGAPELPQGNVTPTDELLLAVPSVELPRGGGAVQGIGQTFQANPVTGTGSMSVPLPVSPGRGGVQPELQLSYDSGAGNSPFGHGWQVGIPNIQRKTSKGLPTYRDGSGSGTADEDVFVFSEAEELVPLLFDANGGVGEPDWQPDVRTEGTVTIVRYRPRVEGGFARIERHRDSSTGITWWTTVSSANVVRTYGASASARVADPADPSRVFQWLLEDVEDERGHRVRYEYKAEDRAGVTESSPCEAARRKTGVAYAYPKRVLYGNATMGVAGDWAFQLVFDYGEHDTSVPTPSEDLPWPVRLDPFSSFRAGFDQRCYRLCRRVLMFHDFTELGTSPVCVRSTELTHTPSAHLTKLVEVVQRGWVPDGQGGYDTEALPRVAFDYTEAALAEQLGFVSGLDDLPPSLDLARWQWVDLDGEGLSGLLAEQGGRWFYKRNEGEGTLGAVQRLPSQPGLSLRSGAQLQDLEGDGVRDLVMLRKPLAGYQPREGSGWGRFRPFEQVPDVDPSDPNVRVLDLDGDGHADLLVTEHDVLRWYPNQTTKGYGAPKTVRVPHSDDDGPRVVFASDSESLFLADMSGDGLTDLVRVRNRSICYWPNLGYGRFGAKVTMGSAPSFGHPGRFDPARVQLADVDGSGPADLVYLGPDHVRIWRNASGNGFGAAEEVTRLPGVDDARTVQVADLLGDGTACLVWSSALLTDRHRPLRYLRLMADGKPHLLRQVDNGLGRVTTLSYAPSTQFYLADRAAGQPWATKLSFPVQVLASVEVLDQVTGWRFTNRYAYHHGTYDGVERAFRGFGMVEQWDTERISDHAGPGDVGGSGTNEDLVHEVPPVRTRTWFHTGVWRAHSNLLAAYAGEYWSGDSSAATLPPCTLPSGLSPDALREAHYALKGKVLRREVYADDGSAESVHPYTVEQTSYAVRQLQPRQGAEPGSARYGSYLVVDQQSMSWSYERNPSDPRVSHTLTLQVDDYGHATRTAVVSYPRRSPAKPAQGELAVVVSTSTVLHDDSSDTQYHLGLAVESQSYELTGVSATDASPFDAATLDAAIDTALAGTVLDYEDIPAGGTTVELRRLSHTQTVYWADDLSGPLTLGSVGQRALVYERYALAMTDGLLTNVYGTDVTLANRTAAGYVQRGGSDAWVPSGRTTLDATAFYQPTAHTDPFGNVTTLTYDSYDLVLVEVEDAVGNTTSATIDYRLLRPSQVTDANGQSQAVAFDPLGRVTAVAVLGMGDTLSAPTAQFAYDDGRWLASGLPARVHSQTRETHDDSGTRWLESYAYSDGGGQVVATKTKVAPGLAPERDGNGDLVFVNDVLQTAQASTRWVGSGRTVLDNKGQPVKQYEPYFDSQAEYTDEDELVAFGVSAVLHYDPVGRLVRTDYPDGTYATVTYDGWTETHADGADNVAGTDWYTERQALASTDPDHRASDLSYAHRDTPLVRLLDAQGRTFLLQEDNDDTSPYETHFALDIAGHPLTLTDARGNATQTQVVDLLGRTLHTSSPDAGDTDVFLDVAGQPVKTWRSGGLVARTVYDALRRPVQHWVDEGSGERLAEAFVYGDAVDVAASRKALGRLFRTYDGAGLQEVTSYDAKGNPLGTERTFLDAVSAEVDWDVIDGDTTVAALDSSVSTAGLLQSTSYTTSTTYDAQNRPVTQTTPDSSVTRTSYDEGGALQAVEVDVRGATPAVDIVTDITYDARGRRLGIDYGNGTATAYTYDALSQRLTKLVTTRSSDSTTLQDLRYFYDAVGNIVELQDHAQQTTFFANTQVDPHATYTYDALYRLVGATGREKVSLAQAVQSDPTYGVVPDPGTTVLRTYSRSYAYDEVGNITQMAQSGDWTRTYTYASGSNRLLSNSAPGGGTHSYSYSDRGAMTAMPHLDTMTRDWRDQLREVDLGSGDDAVYHYDAQGQRVRKVVTLGANVHERLYLPGWELYTKAVSGTVDVERETLHVMDDRRRVAMIETLTIDAGSTVSTPVPRYRFQLDNQLGSACLEVDDAGAVITYEEYHPYGTTAWHAEKAGIQVSQKRYRYTGMERDDETGLAVHGVRFYAPWLGRWCSADPSGLVDGPNRYRYARCSPNNLRDPSGRIPMGDPEGPTQPTPAQEAGALHGRMRATLSFVQDENTKLRNYLVTGDSEHLGLTLMFDIASRAAGNEGFDPYVAAKKQLGENADFLTAVQDQGLAHKEGTRVVSSIRDNAVSEGLLNTPEAVSEFNQAALVSTIVYGAITSLMNNPLTGLLTTGKGEVATAMAKHVGGGSASRQVARSLRHGDASKGGGLFANKFPSHEIGPPIQTFTAQQARRSSFSRKLNYVVTEAGELRLGRIKNDVGGGHIDLAGGAPVQAAGEVKIVDGQIRMIDNSSGHYLPSGAGAQAAAETAFQNAGFSTAGTYVEKVWSGSAWVAK